MDHSIHDPEQELTEFEREWHHLRMARRGLEVLAVIAALAGFAYWTWPAIFSWF
jgi:hypothetical protein